ncbi:MAG: hypothetical protein H0U76_02600 [Ktedonobacteraceae bacterium]|nr:hypothetical protein [Ktedonobacteraceae bacterium]MBA3825036.1 hypothetical protein [Ktedonobacterales bacterium]
MGSQFLREYLCLGGTARRYRVHSTGETISYRQFLKRTQQICPEKRAAERKAAGLFVARKIRKDKGLSRLHPSARQRRKLAPLTIPVRVVSVGKKALGMWQVLYEGKSLGQYHDRGHGARRFSCEVCHLPLREELSMIHHLYNTHRVSQFVTPDAISAALPPGGGRVLYTGHVQSNERRSRMPWRVSPK